MNRVGVPRSWNGLHPQRRIAIIYNLVSRYGVRDCGIFVAKVIVPEPKLLTIYKRDPAKIVIAYAPLST